MTTPTFMPSPCACTSKSSITGLESSVSAICADLLEEGVARVAVELDLEPLALADVAHAGEAEARQRAEHGLALGVEDLGLGHDIDDVAGHGVLLGTGGGGRARF